MKKNYRVSKQLNNASIDVKSSLYGVTTCVINLTELQNGETVFPCGDGSDYQLSPAEIKKNKKSH